MQNIAVTGFMPNQLPETTADGTPQPIILQNITVRPVNRQSQDISKWRIATRAAEATIPRRVLLYDIYAEVMLDGHVISETQKLYDAVTNTNWHFMDREGNPVDEVNELMDSLGFNDLLTEITKSTTWGYSMIECDFKVDWEGKRFLTAFQCDRKHMRPLRGVITFEQTGDAGINIRDGIYPNFVLEAGDPRDLGLLCAVAQYSILKDGDISDWAAFVQTFGQPIVDAEWDGYDENQRIQLNDAISGIGAGGSITRPAGTKINLLENKANGDGKLQGNLLDAMNKEISKTLLGSTEATQSSNSSGYAQSQTHMEIAEERKKALVNYVRRILNSRFRRILDANGFNVRGGIFTVVPTKKELSLKDAYDIFKSMVSDLDIPISDDFFYENFGADKPVNYDELKAALLAVKAQNQVEGQPNNPGENADTPTNSDGNKGKKPDEQKPPKDKKPVKLSWFREALSHLSFFAPAPAQTATGATMTTTACCGNHQPVIDRFITLADKSDTNAFLKRFYDSGGKPVFDAETFFYTAQILVDGINQGWHGKPMIQLADLGFTYGVDDPALLTSFELNLFRFAGVKTLAQAQELNKLFRESKSFADFLEKAQQVTDIFNKTWLQTEYQTAYLTGESSATYARLMKQTKLFPYWEYRTVGDDRVRPAHAVLNGLILPANDPRWNKIYPPNGWNCRCYVVPRTKAEVAEVDLDAMRAKADAYFETSEFKTAEAQGWGVNRAVTGEVFTANQQYIRKFEGKAAKMLNDLGPADFGLKQYSQAKKVATEAMPVFDGTASQFLKDLAGADGNAQISDYNKRPLELEPKNFDFHTTGKKESRVALLTAMQETIEKPDEVWLSGDKLEDLTYIKYYTDKTIVVVAEVKNGKVTEVSTWFDLAEVKLAIERVRHGLLILGK